MFQVKVLRELRKLPQSWFEKISQRVTRGTPDIIGVVAGRMVALELKSKHGKASPLQILKLREIELAGGHADVVYPDNFPEVLKKLWAYVTDEHSMTFSVGKKFPLETGNKDRREIE